MKCIGFDKKEGKCESSVSVKYQSVYWCDVCEETRRKHIIKQMENILASFPNKHIELTSRKAAHVRR